MVLVDDLASRAARLLRPRSWNRSLLPHRLQHQHGHGDVERDDDEREAHHHAADEHDRPDGPERHPRGQRGARAYLSSEG